MGTKDKGEGIGSYENSPILLTVIGKMVINSVL